MTRGRVLSIQSHVVRGYVGNKCATLPLQLHGFEIDAVNSVQFSAHTFYEHWKGQVLNAEQLGELYEGLRLCNLTRKYTHLLTGYCRDETFLHKIADILNDLRKTNPHLYYICDPVMGDRDHYYVPDHLMPIYRDVITKLANVVTPNQFELQQLTDVPVDSESSCLQAIDVLHDRGIKAVVVTSTDLAPNQDKEMFVYGSTANSDSTKTRFRYRIRKLDATFVGTGDLFTALLLAWMSKTDRDLCQSVGNVLRTMQIILSRTIQSANEEVKADGLARGPGPAELELRLVDNIETLVAPTADNELVKLEPIS